jgi:hypothetical protein
MGGIFSRIHMRRRAHRRANQTNHGEQGRPPGDTWKTNNKGETPMTASILRAMPLVEMVVPKMQALYLRLTCALDTACSKRTAGARFSRPNCSAAVTALRPRTTTISQLPAGHQTLAQNGSVLDQSEPPSRRAARCGCRCGTVLNIDWHDELRAIGLAPLVRASGLDRGCGHEIALLPGIYSTFADSN